MFNELKFIPIYSFGVFIDEFSRNAQTDFTVETK